MTRKVPHPKSIAGRFKKDVKHLKETLPPLLPVRVYRRDCRKHDCLGYTYINRDDSGVATGFVIAVCSTISWDAAWQVLVHEWAHALAWLDGHETVDDHGPEWALALSRVYQESVQA